MCDRREGRTEGTPGGLTVTVHLAICVLEFGACFKGLDMCSFSILVLVTAGQTSSWTTFRRSSSMCTGAYTGEMGLALAQKIVNESQILGVDADIRCVAAWATALVPAVREVDEGLL